MAESDLALGIDCGVFVSRCLFLLVRQNKRTGRENQHSAAKRRRSFEKGDCTDF